MLSILTIKLSIDIDNIMSVISAILLTPSKAPIQQSAWLLKTRERENISNICTVYSKVINSFVEIYIKRIRVYQICLYCLSRLCCPATVCCTHWSRSCSCWRAAPASPASRPGPPWPPGGLHWAASQPPTCGMRTCRHWTQATHYYCSDSLGHSWWIEVTLAV